MIIRLKGATFSTNIGTLDSWSIKVSTSGGTVIPASGNADSIKKDDTNGEILEFEFDTAKYTYKSGTIMSNGVSAGTISVSGNTITVNVNAGTTLSGKVEINFVMEAIDSGEPDTPDTSTNYTFTINPTPASATVTLSATGYTTVSGTGNQSITVADGTTVSWSVSATGYTTQSGTQSVTSTSSKSVILSASSGGSGTNDITSYVTDGKAITNLNGTVTMSGFFTVVNYPAREGFSYKIPYGRNGYFSNASGVISTAIFQGAGSESFVTPDAPAGTTMLSVCFKHADLAPADVIIEEKEGTGTVSSNPDIGITTTSYGGEVKTGHMVGSAGSVTSNSETNVIDMIPVKSSTTYQLVEGCRNTAILNSAGEVIQLWGGTTMENKNYIFTTTADTVYMRTCYYWNNVNYPKLSVAKFTLTEITE